VFNGFVVDGIVLSLLAGLSTTVGALIALVATRGGGMNKRWLSGLLGLAAGVMIAVSFVELLAGAVAELDLTSAGIAFFTGFIVIFLIDVVVPHDYQTERTEEDRDCCDPTAWPPPDPDEICVCEERTGILTALGIAIHNLPEGLVIVSGAAASPELGLLLAVAIAMHNIPEGIAVAVPIVEATGNRAKAIWYTFLSGLAEPVGAVLGALILAPYMTPEVIQLSLAGVAGVMVFIGLDELLPTAHRYGEEHATTVGVLAGMMLMVATLVILR
jgi:ZIP family zinc transporter